jgi:F0F1-type ATP synthase epsilon subunit
VLAESLRLIVCTPSETVIEAEQVQWVHVKLVQAKTLTIWPGHARLLAETNTEALRYADAGGEHTVDLPAGILQVWDNTVTLYLAGTLGERAWSQDREERFDRLAEAMLRERARQDVRSRPVPTQPAQVS